MNHFIRTLMIVLGIALIIPACDESDRSENISHQEANRTSRLPVEKRPEHFEPYLEAHPEDVESRTAALHWYALYDHDVNQLSFHTREMIKYHPGEISIFFMNRIRMDSNLQYSLEIIQLLEEQVASGHTEHGVYINLALFYEHIGYDQQTENYTNKAIDNYKLGIAATKDDESYIVFYSRMLAKFFLELKKPNEAIAICENALLHLNDESDPDFLVIYGEALHQSGSVDKAIDILTKVRSLDTEGFENGPGHATADAETKLGMIAIEQGDIETAKKYLLSSCNVQRCCHNSTFGLTLELAEVLFEKGECDVVAKYCQTLLEEFTPGREEIINLLEKAQNNCQ